MSPKTRIVSAKQMIKALEKDGYSVVRQKGSHIRLQHQEKSPVTVPNHSTLGIGITQKILKDAELSMAELIELLRK